MNIFEEQIYCLAAISFNTHSYSRIIEIQPEWLWSPEAVNGPDSIECCAKIQQYKLLYKIVLSKIFNSFILVTGQQT